VAQFIEQAFLEREQSGEVQLAIASRFELLLEFKGVPGSQRFKGQHSVGREAHDSRRQNRDRPDNKAPEYRDQAMATFRQHF